MKELFLNISTLVFFIVIGVFIVGLFNPKTSIFRKFYKTSSRKRIAIYNGAALLALFILIGFLAPPVEKQVDNSSSKQPETTQTKPSVTTTSAQSELYEVAAVVDGDTVDVKIGGKTERIRLIGLDTPETLDPRKAVQCYGKEASDQAKQTLAGKKVRLETDQSQGDKDKYGRLLRYLFLEDGTNFNKSMIEAGFAHEYTYNTPYKYQSEFKLAQSNAEKSAVGLWAATTCGGDTTKPAQQAKQETSQQPVAQPAPQPSTNNCDPNYSPCVKNVSYDLDCSDIGFRVTVIGTDRHRLDRDGNGIGCESY